MKQTKETREQQDRRNGYALMGAAAFLLCSCLYHQARDAVRYPWLLSPYLFPALLTGVLGVLGLLLVLRSRKGGR